MRRIGKILPIFLFLLPVQSRASIPSGELEGSVIVASTAAASEEVNADTSGVSGSAIEPDSGAIVKTAFVFSSNLPDSIPDYRPRGKRSIKAPSPYRLRLQKELPIAIMDGGIYIAAPFLLKNAPVLDPINIQNNVWKWERNIYKNNSEAAAVASDVLLYTSIMAPFAMIADKSIRNDVRTYVIYAETAGTALAVTALIKGLARRPRPFVYNPNTPADRIINPNATQSFLSGHTAMVAANLYFIATIYAQHHPKGKLRPYLWAGAAVLPALTGYLRVASGNHFPTDVLAGYILGAVIGYAIPTLHKIHTKKVEKTAVPKKL